MNKRQAVYHLRWQVLSRDNFTCQYCGQHAPDVILHVDHREAIANGGNDALENLVTSCWACNIGKGLASLLPEAPPKVTYKRPTLIRDQVLAALTAGGAQTATELSLSLGWPRETIARICIRDTSIQKLPREGKNQRYDRLYTGNV